MQLYLWLLRALKSRGEIAQKALLRPPADSSALSNHELRPLGPDGVILDSLLVFSSGSAASPTTRDKFSGGTADSFAGSGFHSPLSGEEASSFSLSPLE